MLGRHKPPAEICVFPVIGDQLRTAGGSCWCRAAPLVPPEGAALLYAADLTSWLLLTEFNNASRWQLQGDRSTPVRMGGAQTQRLCGQRLRPEQRPVLIKTTRS